MEKINESDFEELSLESLQIDTSEIMKTLPLEQNDERLLLYKNHQLAIALLNSQDTNLKIFLITTMRNIFQRYLSTMRLDNDSGIYNDLLNSLTIQGQITFNNKMRNIKQLMIDYVKNSYIYGLDFALNKIVEITKYFIEFINPLYTIELDLSLLKL